VVPQVVQDYRVRVEHQEVQVLQGRMDLQVVQVAQELKVLPDLLDLQVPIL
jgi:hypothetical protein